MEKAGNVPITQQVCAISLSAVDQDEHCAAPSAERYRRRITHYRRAGLLGAGQGCEVERATTGAELEQAYHLVHQVYCQQGYIWPDPSGLRIRPFEALPQMATFVVKRDGCVVAVTSVLPDSSDLGLPSDVSFRQELSVLRSQGRRVCEITNLAVAAPYRNSQVFLELTRACLSHAQSLQADDLFIAICPSHARFFQDVLLFEPWGDRRSYSRQIEDIVEGGRLNLRGLDQRARAADAVLAEQAFLHRHYFQANPYNQRVQDWSARAQRLFLDPRELRRLFLQRSKLLHRCDEQARAAIRRRWGRETYERVFTRPAVAVTV